MVTRHETGTLSGYPVELLQQWLQASCDAQGVPPGVRDPQVVADVAVLLGGSVGGGTVRRGAPVPGSDRTVPPAVVS